MATQISLNDGAVASAGALAIQTNGTTQAVSISTGQVATLAQNPILTSGTANGVAYLNGSKVLTTGSALVFDGSNLGINVTSPATKLDVSGVASTNGSTRFLAKFADTSAVAQGNGGGILFRGVYTGTTLVDASGIQAYKVNATDNNYSYGLVFSTRANGGDLTANMRLDESGNLLVGTTSATGSGKTVINASSTNPALSLRTPSASGTIAVQIFFDGDDTDCGSIDVNTTANTTAYTTSSDYRLKENVTKMTGALATVGQLNPVTWNWKHAPEVQGQGFVAHELAEVCPDAVTGAKDAVDADGKPQYQGIDTSFLVATLTAAIQEQQALITQLTARITALESA